MDVLHCQASAWDVDDFSSCFKQKYLLTAIPLATVGVSAALVFSASLKTWWYGSRVRGYVPVGQDDDPFRRPAEYNDESAIIDDDDDDDYPIIRMATNANAGGEAQTAVAGDVIDAGKLRVRVVNPRGSSFRVALERTAAFGELAVHGVLLLLMFVDGDIRIALRDHVAWALGGSVFWAYVCVLAVLRTSSSEFLTSFLADSVCQHVYYVYNIGWIVSMFMFRSILLHSTGTIMDSFVPLDFLLATVLLYMAWTVKLSAKPIYLEASEGYAENCEPEASMFSFLSYYWMQQTIVKGFRKPLELIDILDLQPGDRAHAILVEFRRKGREVSFFLGLIRYFKRQIVYGMLWAGVHSFATFVPTLLIRRILEYMEDPVNIPANMGWFYVAMVFVAGMVDTVTNNQSYWNGRKICTKIKAIIIGELYAKALRRKTAAEAKEAGEDEETDVGGIINLMAVDAFKVAELCAYLHSLVASVFMMFVAMVMLYQTLGASALAGVATIILLIPGQYWFSVVFGRCQEELMKRTDRRVQKTNEVLNAIKIIKYFAWEKRFRDSLNDARAEELHMLYRRYLIWAISSVVWYGTPVYITLATFGFYTLGAKKELTAPVAFSALALFNLLRIPLDQMSEMFKLLLQCRTSIIRIQDFLNEPETTKYEQLQAAVPEGPAIGFRGAEFAWGAGRKANEFRLRDLDVEFRLGRLNLVIGPTGSGKTSLLMALLGEMNLLKGSVHLPGLNRFGERTQVDRASGMADSVAYCAQQAWLTNDTVRNNILFGNPVDEERYEAVVEACGLRRDFQILTMGDRTEVGERGIALSGGQKQRISLARALYSPARHLLLDDCLSAVDSHTAVWIYEHCITGPLMAERTCILVSHNVALTLTSADHVVYMDRGAVAMQGTPEQVYNAGLLGDDELLRQSASMATSRSLSRTTSMANLKKQVDIAVAVEAIAEAETSSSTASDDKKAKAEDDGELSKKLVEKEHQSIGSVKWSVYTLYLSSLGNAWFWVAVSAIYIGLQLIIAGQSYWVKLWAADPSMGNGEIPIEVEYVPEMHAALAGPAGSSGSALYALGAVRGVAVATGATVAVATPAAVAPATPAGHSTVYYLLWYAVITLTYTAVIFTRDAVLFWGSIRASTVLFNRLLHKVLRSKLRFFDATPIGRIMNRFSKDMEIVDQEAAPTIIFVFHSIFSVFTILAIIIVLIPEFVVATVVIFALFAVVVVLYLQTSRELKRMEAVTRSPIYQHFGETLVGITTIRAYGYEDQFIAENEARIDHNNRPFWNVWACNRWMSFRVDTIGVLVSFSAAAFVVVSVGRIDSGLAGLTLSYAVTFTEALLWFVWVYAQNEMNMNSLERISEYMDIEEEADEIVEGTRPPANWPDKGAISVQDLSLKYAPGLPNVIRNVSFDVAPNYKVGIVGRTGAGKSTIASAFFRFLEAETGRIVIDGVDIATIGLYDLRSSLTIIPQDPTLFSGTIRSNLDPFDAYSDAAVFQSLLRVNLIDVMPASAGGPPDDDASLSVVERHKRRANPFYDLASPVTEAGGNLSQGQRQLMCLARSLLKAPKIILLDEATASIDYATDAQIQDTIRQEFSQTTVITIAHRLRSIIDYDMILVLDAGQVKEYAKPHTLLQQPDSIFRSMCENSGELEQLEELAAKAFVAQGGVIPAVP
ncbi:P-loop containing nucleoside triphosphate hydrolase protein [Dipodascopsis tothii]|uniref:P-loop containing nucleoside triphosphate hydrolase protein n=1 Tax=Dipodascopsis tothii TaxID=44089 RepID=UPI0034CE74A7